MSDLDPRLDPNTLALRYRRVRAVTEALAAPLEPEDQCVQSMPDASPTKWHLAHTSWFFETFVLDPPHHRPGWDVLFNSYYQAIGAMHPRAERGLLSRPTVAEIREYRRVVDDRVCALLERGPTVEQLGRIELGLEHEQQHQELILTDIKHLFGRNPLAPSYRSAAPAIGAPSIGAPSSPSSVEWIESPGGLIEVGRELDRRGFGFDNESPRHKQWLEPYTLASRPATCAEYLAFIADDGYSRADLWLAEGWDLLAREGWRAPMYWRDAKVFTLGGLVELELDAPVCHLSYFEADAFARWSGARLPTEAEWEHLAMRAPVSGNLLPIEAHALDRAALHPLHPGPTNPNQWFGDVWEWTASPYVGYPGYRPPIGAIGEYNGKFMSNQWVLRGGSCVTPADHVRASYRNFFPAPTRWQFTGVRLAR